MNLFDMMITMGGMASVSDILQPPKSIKELFEEAEQAGKAFVDRWATEEAQCQRAYEQQEALFGRMQKAAEAERAAQDERDRMLRAIYEAVVVNKE